MSSAAQQPDLDHRAAKARKLDGQADTLIKTGKAAEALTANERAICQWRALVKDDAQFTVDLARSLDRGRDLAEQTGQVLDAIANGTESMRLWKRLAEQEFEGFGPRLYRAQRALAGLLTGRNQRDAVGINAEAAKVMLRLLAGDEAQYLLPAAQVCFSLAKWGGRSGDSELGREYAQKSVELWRRLAEQDLIRHGPRLVLALKQLSREMLDDQGRWYKPALREARKVQLARLVRLVLSFPRRLRTEARQPEQAK